MADRYCTLEFCTQVLTRLIAINSAQPQGNERLMAEEILSFFPEDIHHTIIEHSKTRCTLVIKIPGQVEDGGIAFLGHTDTVAFGDERLWKYPPLSATLEDGCIYGRGASDMKGGDTAMIAAALSIIDGGRTPSEPIYFCFTADEENRGGGAKALVDMGIISGVREVWIPEPTNGAMGISEKGALWLRVTARGKSAHASRPDVGVSSIEWLLRLYGEIKDYLDKGGENPYLGTNTVSLTRLNGGIATNIIPSFAQMELDIRTIPGVSHDDIFQYVTNCIKQTQEETLNLSMDVEVLNNRLSLEVSEADPFIRRIEMVWSKTQGALEKKGVYFYTDASQIVPILNKPFVIMGPGEETMAHRCNERVNIEDVAFMAKLYADYLEEYY